MPATERLGVDHQRVQRFIPKEHWDHQSVRMRHREKWRLALDMLDEMTPTWRLPKRPVVADSGYDDATEVRPGPHQRGTFPAPTLTTGRRAVHQVTRRHGSRHSWNNPIPRQPDDSLPAVWLIAQWPATTSEPTDYWLSNLRLDPKAPAPAWPSTPWSRNSSSSSRSSPALSHLPPSPAAVRPRTTMTRSDKALLTAPRLRRASSDTPGIGGAFLHPLLLEWPVWLIGLGRQSWHSGV
jgi:DDE superfamily endonuclease